MGSYGYAKHGNMEGWLIEYERVVTGYEEWEEELEDIMLCQEYLTRLSKAKTEEY
jgi:hypothetical protein